MAVPHCLPARSAVGADDVALPRCCHPMVHVVLVVGGGGRRRGGEAVAGVVVGWWWLRKERLSMVDGTKSSVGVCQGLFGRVKWRRYYIE